MGEMNELDAWVAAACSELGLAPADVQSEAVLDVARDVAHQVLRPGAPLTAYLMGVAVGRGADPAETAARISALALAWPQRESATPQREGATPPREGATPQREGATPQREGAAPRRESASNVSSTTTADPPTP
jgi:hypothetical protein